MRTLILVALTLLPLAAQSVPPPRITQAIDSTQRVRLVGNTPRRVAPQDDQGVVAAALPLPRMLLLLSPNASQRADLAQLLDAQQNPNAAAFHAWLTPAQFRARFGPAPADLSALTAWLSQQGFTVNHVASSGLVIDFSGTAAQVAATFHAPIHSYRVNGKSFLANAADPEIPAALAGIVAGIVSLNNVRKTAGRLAGAGSFASTAAGQPHPSLTFTDTNGQTEYAMAPADFNAIYNLATPPATNPPPTIAVLGRASVRLADITDFRNLFVSSSTSPPVLVVNNGPAPDSSQFTLDDVFESSLDMEWSGAADPNAALDYVTSASTNTTDGIDLSALYAVDQNLAPIISLSYGQCEQDMGAAENAFYTTLWQQAAAEGISVFVSSGDSGAAGCDADGETVAVNGLGVNGLASTPFDTAVGGTEFNDAANPGVYWNSTNGSLYLSARGHIPEVAWNETTAAGIGATGGGVSTVYTSKPAWQSAPGVPLDHARDLPDVALSAASHDGYVICTEASCATSFSFYVVGGTSASAPAFAGIMARIVATAGARQGLANYSLYKLASAQNATACNTAGPAANCDLLDITSGDNQVPCTVGTPDCDHGTLGYPATPGFDLATGLGSVNATNLVNDWGTAKFLPSQTALTLTPITGLTHGQAATVAIRVTPTSGNGTPSGSVALLATSAAATLPGPSFPLDATGSSNATTQDLPGGTYQLSAAYTGDAMFADSASSPVAVTIAPEPATIQDAFVRENADGTAAPVLSAVYGTPLAIIATVAGTSGHGTPTGPSVAQALSPAGVGAAFVPVFSKTGSFSFGAAYAGDASFKPATAAPLSFTLLPAPVSLTLTVSTDASNFPVVTATAAAPVPIGSPFVSLNGVQVALSAAGQPLATLQLSSDGNGPDQAASGAVTLTALTAAPTVNLTASVTSGSNTLYSFPTLPPITVPSGPHLVASATTVSFPATTVGATSAAQTLTLTNNGFAPAIFLVAAAQPFAETTNCPAALAPQASCTVNLTFHPPNLDDTTDTLDLNYGDGAHIDIQLTGTAAGIALNYTGAGATITAGSTAALPVTVAPVAGYSGSVSLFCLAPGAYGLACSVSPTSLPLDGTDTATAMITVTSTPRSSTGAPGPRRSPPPGQDLGREIGREIESLVLLLLFSAFIAAARLRDFRHLRAALAMAPCLLVLSCGGGGGTSAPLPTVPPPTSTIAYSPTAINFGNVFVGQTSPPQTVTVNNVSSAALPVTTVINGRAINATASTCIGNNVAAGSSCATTLSITPTAVGSISGSLLVNYGSLDAATIQTATIPITGAAIINGTPAGTYAITLSALTTQGGPTASTQALVTVH